MSEGSYTVQEYQQAGFQQLLERRHENTIWTRYATAALGLWMVAGLFTFPQQQTIIMLSDFVSGILLVVFGLLSLQEPRRWAPWATCLVGIWLQLAPVLFGAQMPHGYINDTLIGVLAIAFSVLIPGTPGLIESGPEVPSDWSYNPSSWVQRLPVIALSLFAWLITRFLAGYQYGYITSVSDPIFAQGTLSVLSAEISKGFAAFASMLFTLQMLLACKGGSRRWHTMPWIVALYGLFVLAFGLLGSFTILIQPITHGFWCFWCLICCAMMLIMTTLAIDEVVATAQLLLQAGKDGKSFWPTFWHGSAVAGGHVDSRTPQLNAPAKTLFSAMVWGVTLPWNLLVTTFIGFWLMFSPPAVHVIGRVEFTNYFLGNLICLISVLSMAEVARPLRYLNILFGFFIGVAPWLFHDENVISNWNNVISGLLLISCSISRGKVLQHYGPLDRFIR